LTQGASSGGISDASAPVIGRSDLATLPNLVSLSRIVGVTVAVLLYFAGYPLVTVVLGTIACLTDYVDGYLARRLSQETVLGAMLDQAADSYTTGIALAMLVIAGGFPFVFLVIFLGREFWVATVRRYAAMGGLEIQSHVSGKVATGFIYWAMLLMAVTIMLEVPAGIAARLQPVATAGMIVGLAFSCTAAWRYTRALAGTAR
jgi:CDP-diacylglycerol--glycerol-3-phosphate 3-phosphatidyltransferase